MSELLPSSASPRSDRRATQEVRIDHHPPSNMNRGHPGSMIDEKLDDHPISTSRRCPSCDHELDCKPKDMAGLPAGVKFDPTDKELIEHLEAKVKEGGSRAHPLIDEFILTIQGEDGICYTHPEKLPGVKRDGLSKHFFHRPSKAYTTGTRKRRKIQTVCDLLNSKSGGETRWHKTGKTRPVIVAGRQKGCKKILVLYNNFGKHRKPEKTNWVMHQYHLGDLEEEKEGELIVSKVFYQTQQRQSATVAATVDQIARAGDTVAEKPGEMQHGLPGCAVAVEVQRQQQQQLKQADCQFITAPPKKRSHEVGVDQVTVDQGGEQHDHHRMPSQHHISPNLQAEVVPATCSLTGKPLNPVSTIVSPAIRHTSVVLKNQLRSPDMLLRNENFQMNNQKEGQQQKLDHRSAGLEELIMASQSTSTKGGTSIPQSQETQWPYQYWPPDNRDQHG